MELRLVGRVQVIDRSLRGFRVVTFREEGEVVLEILDVVRTLNRVPEALFARRRAFGDRLFNFGVQPDVGGETPGKIGGLTTTGLVLDPGTDVGEEGHGFAVHAREAVVEDRREDVGVVLLAQVTGAGLNRHQRQRALAVRGRGGTVGDLCTRQQRLELVIGEVAVVGVHDHHVGDLITLHLGPDIVHGDEVEREVQTGGDSSICGDKVGDTIDAHYVPGINEQPVFRCGFTGEESGQGSAGLMRAGVGQQGNVVAIAAQRLREHGRVGGCIRQVHKIRVVGIANDQCGRLGCC